MKGRTWLLSGFGAAAPEFCAQVTQGVCELSDKLSYNRMRKKRVGPKQMNQDCKTASHVIDVSRFPYNN